MILILSSIPGILLKIHSFSALIYPPAERFHPTLEPAAVVADLRWPRYRLWAISHRPEAREHAVTLVRPVPCQARCVLWYRFIASANSEQVVSDLCVHPPWLAQTERWGHMTGNGPVWCAHIFIISYMKHLHTFMCRLPKRPKKSPKKCQCRLSSSLFEMSRREEWVNVFIIAKQHVLL